MVNIEDTTDRSTPELPAGENELSRRYLRMMERWIPVGVEYFAEWPERPNCGHFLDGVHWYGQETVSPAETFALASVSPEYDEQGTGVSREDLRRMVIQAVRYLCFTHDTGPGECVRPGVGLGRPENCGTKWGERGKGFFRESQCGSTVAGLGRICLLLGEWIDDETWRMVARVHEDYAERFGAMPPRSGVYLDTQMEENAWTSYGLASCFLFLSRHEQAAAWEATARRWMFSTCATPQDAKDLGEVGGSTARELTGKIFTALPDYWAENHGMVHPSYTGSGVRSLMTVGSQLKLWGRDLPPEVLWNRRRVYENLLFLTDGAGYPQAVQGMDWHYLPTVGSETPHAIGAVFFDDPDAAALQRRGLRNAELRQEGNGGRMYDRDFALKAHDQQDPMIMRELTIRSVAHLYLLHRLFGPGPEPTPEEELEGRLAGVRSFPHAGFVHHRHSRGQTSFSWRNSIMALPLTREGIYTIAPCSNTWLGTPVVKGRPESQRLESIQVVEYGDGFAAAMVMHRCQESLRQEVLFASLPDGRVLSFERFVAREDVTVEALDQGFLRITNEHFPLLAPNCQGVRTLYRPDGATEYRGWLGDRESDDAVNAFDGPEWLNIDDRMGIRFSGTGRTIYQNRHYFRPYRAIADDLTLSRQEGEKVVRAGEEIGYLAAMLCPEQHHDDTATTVFTVQADRPPAVAMITDGFLAAANFGSEGRARVFHLPRTELIPVYPGVTLQTQGDRLDCVIRLDTGSPILVEALCMLRVNGDVQVDAISGGPIYVTNMGDREADVEVRRRDRAEKTWRIAPGKTCRA